jgi:molybdopterin-guanine dinucleotide biosynthesis protein B
MNCVKPGSSNDCRQLQRWALMTETPEEPPLDLAWLVSRMDASTLDLVLVEGLSMKLCPRSCFFGKTADIVLKN